MNKTISPSSVAIGIDVLDVFTHDDKKVMFIVPDNRHHRTVGRFSFINVDNYVYKVTQVEEGKARLGIIVEEEYATPYLARSDPDLHGGEGFCAADVCRRHYRALERRLQVSDQSA